jgi:hypothetical protein
VSSRSSSNFGIGLRFCDSLLAFTDNARDERIPFSLDLLFNDKRRRLAGHDFSRHEDIQVKQELDVFNCRLSRFDESAR